MRVWAFDPGATTGVALMTNYEVVYVAQYSDIANDVIVSQIKKHDTVIYEKLHCSPGFLPIGFEAIGVIKYFCKKQHIVAVAQSPIILAGPTVWPSMKIVRLNFKSQHIRDAIYHLAAFSMKHGEQIRIKEGLSYED